MSTENVLFALGLTFFAGLSTGIGSVMAFFSRKFNPNFLCASLGFSAGVMIYVSFIEIFVKAKDSLTIPLGETKGYWVTVIAFFAGIVIITIIDKLVPSFENPHEIKNIDSGNYDDERNRKLLRMGLFSALAIGIHNFPEGLATFMGALNDPALGISIAVAIAIHNIPEGISVSIPIYYATKSKWKSFGLSLGSGIAEPIGAAIAFAILGPFLNDTILAISLAAVAGIMVYISIDELIPVAHEYGKGDLVMAGVVIGMIIMAGSLVLFEFL